MGLRDFLDRTGDIVMGFPSLVKGVAEITDDFVNDVKVDWDDLKKEEREIMREMGRDLTDKISSDARGVLETAFLAEDKARKGINNFVHTIKNPTHIGRNAVTTNDLYTGDHVFVMSATGITHHGIYVGSDEIIHYSIDKGSDICIHSVTFDDFADGRKVFKMSKSESPTRYEGSEIANRAWGRMYENAYNLVFNNCEHFARWCRFGD